MAKRPRSRRPGVSAAKEAASPHPLPEPTGDSIVQHEQVRRTFDLLRDEASPCWQMAFLAIYDGWDVGLQRFLGKWVGGQREPAEYHRLAVDEGENHLDDAGVSYTTPEAAWNATVLEFTLFLYGRLKMPGPDGVSSHPALSLRKAVLSSAP